MKKLILTAALASVTALSGFSQGQIAFQNALTSQIWFNSTSTGTKASSATIAAQGQGASTGVIDVGLFWSTTPFNTLGQGTLAATDTMSATAGTIAGGTALLAGTAAGDNVYVQVYAWDSTYATPALAVQNGAFFGAASAGPGNAVYGTIGASQLVSALTVSPGPPNPIFGTGAGQFGRTVLLQGPEPTTIAIGGLGAAALLMMRRRKK